MSNHKKSNSKPEKLKPLKVRNPVARSPLMRKGGVHQRSVSSQRQQTRDSIKDEAQHWRDEIEQPSLPDAEETNE